MLRTIDPKVLEVALRIVEIQRAAYAIEADLIGFGGIPQLVETEGEVRELGQMTWMGAFLDDLLVGLVAWEKNGDKVEIDRLAVDPAFARQGFGRRLVQAVPSSGTTIVSTGEENHPAVSLYLSEGFERTGSLEVAPTVMVAQFRRSN